MTLFADSERKRSRFALVALASLMVGGLRPATVAASDPAIDSPAASAASLTFNDDIRPILSENCFHCHGPDEATRAADLRLDVREDAIDYGAIAPGEPDESELIARVTSDDADLLMPPADSHRSVTESQKEVLRTWIAEGAVYDEHWGFKNLPDQVDLPEDRASGWARTDLDRFVYARQREAGLDPSPEAKPLVWFRRVCFDLTGLPPTVEQIAEFRQAYSNDTATAYDDAVGRLLAAPEYGEHMAIAWLDAARYADSYGYQSDKLNTQWPYRDWVVRALNNNLPYDQFITWQLAGDLLPNPTRGQRLATAFNRLHRLNNEGGAVFEEWRIENVADRVHTYGTAVLGLTMECCRCHDHKYDPISQRDYYALSAFFNSIDENGLYDRTEKVPSPSMLLPTDEQDREIAAAVAARDEAQSDYKAAVEQAHGRYDAWRATLDTKALGVPDREFHLPLDGDTTIEDAGSDDIKAFVSTNDRNKTDGLEFIEVVNCPFARGSENPKAAALDGERGFTINGVPEFDRWTRFSLVLTLRDKEHTAQRSVIAHHTHGTDAGYNGWDLMIEDGHLESRLYRVWPGNAIGVRTAEALPADKWVHVTATYDGSSEAEGLRLFLDGEELEVEILRDEIIKKANVAVDHGGALVLGQRFRDRGLAGGELDSATLYYRALTPAEIRSLATGKPIEPTFDYYCSAIDETCRKASEALRATHERYAMAEEVVQEVPIMDETDEPRPAYVLARGEYDAPKNDDSLVERSTFTSILQPFPEGQPRDRLGLARWTVSDNHPLTARVAVNRLWANFFGVGLVATPENFGVQGSRPTNPALLDWLARDFVDNGWDIKRFCRNVVLSATYRQASRSTPAQIASDPTNSLLARGAAFRLSAEQIRDAVLEASGLLNPERGGPPVSPYQPGDDLWKESNVMSPSYKQSVGESLYRRSLYSVWKRTAPLPNMLAFDAGSRETCIVARSRTNTPLQALVLLNDVQFIEACRALASRAVREDQSDTKRIDACFTAFAGRAPTDNESALLIELLSEERDYYQANPIEAEKLLRLGDLPVSNDVEPSELAAMTVVCQAILNLDATVWRR